MDAPAESIKPDFADLRAELKSALGSATPPAGTPPAAPAPTPEQAPEPKPEATPTQQQATETPSEPEAKPETTPDEDLAFAAKLAGLDPAVIEKIASADPAVASAARAIAQKAIEYNNRLAEQARQAKAQQATPQTPPQQPAPPAAPVAATPADWTDDTIEATVEAWVLGDPQRRIPPDRECASLSARFDAEAKTIAELASEVDTLAREELILRELTDAGRRTRLGLPEPDEFAASEQKTRLRDIQTDLRNKKADLRERQEVQARLHQAYHDRKAGFRQHMVNERETQRRARQQQQEVEEKANRYEQSWRGTISAVFDELKVRPDLREKAFNFARRTALAEGAPDEAELKTWMAATVKEFLEPVAMSHRAMESSYAQTKIADAQTFGSPAATPIPPKPAPAPGDFRTELRNEMRRRFGA